MDDPAPFGDHLYLLTSPTAVKRELHVDYAGIVLAVEAKHVCWRIQELLLDENTELHVDDAG